MKPILTALVFITYAILVGCAGPSYTNYNYSYQAPPEFAITAKYKTIKSSAQGYPLDHDIKQFTHPLKGLNWVDSSYKAHILFDIKVSHTSLVKNTFEERITETKDSKGNTIKLKNYVYLGNLNTPYELTLFDQRTKKYIARKQHVHKDSVSSEQRANVRYAESSLKYTASSQRPESRRLAMRHIVKTAKRFLDTQLTEHTKNIVFSLPEKDDDEPRLAQAYSILKSSPNKKGATEAKSIYLAIGTNNTNEKGEANEDLNEGVYAGLAACHFILGEMDDYARTKSLSNQKPSIFSTITETYSRF